MTPRRQRRGALVAAALATGAAFAERADDAWPAITRDARPWTYNWWLGSAVDETNIVHELRRCREAGLGGLHIVPIYGARGAENRYVPYLSARWLHLVSFTLGEAAALDMGVDLTVGTGWCFGGPPIDADLGGQTWKMADGRIEVAPTHLRVKRAAPGGDGLMINPFSPRSMGAYLSWWFDRFKLPGDLRPRALYHDSYEYAGCTWAPEVPAFWRQRHGYDLTEELDALAGRGPTDRVARVAADYRAVLSDLLVERVAPLWVQISRARGFVTRLQAHGAAANLLDLYAVADIPETEMFGRGDRDPLRSGFDERFGEGDRDPLVSKFASSAAHLADRPLTAAETGAWMAEHFCETFEELTCLADLLFASGVNHVVYHGCAWSPDDAPWPGWLFYASTQLNSRNPLWREFGAFNASIARRQSALQAGQPEAEVLLYWPVGDLFMTPPPAGAPAAPIWMTVHRRDWLHRGPFGATARDLWRRGIEFDYVSDRALARLSVDTDGKLCTPGGATWRALLVPPCSYMPDDTLRRLVDLVADGATLLWHEKRPSDVPGWGRLAERRARFHETMAAIDRAAPERAEPNGLAVRRLGRGRMLEGPLDVLLAAADLQPVSPAPGDGLLSIRRRLNDGYWFPLAWHGIEPMDRTCELPVAANDVWVFDPLTGRHGRAPSAAIGPRRTAVRVALDPGHSILLRLFEALAGDAPAWRWDRPGPIRYALTGEWSVAFVAGGPELPAPYRTAQLESWAHRGDPAAEAFAGTARYELRFDFQPLEPPAAATSKDWKPTAAAAALDLGDVRPVARVRLNGRDLGARFQRPYRWPLPLGLLQPTDNRLEVEVTNLAANRIRDLDRRGVEWRVFHDINFVNIRYKKFDASQWPVAPSGLLGPVVIRSLLL